MNNKNYAVITGASDGLGLEISKTLWKAGYGLHLISRNKKKLIFIKESFLKNKNNQECLIYPFDIENIEEINNVCDVIIKKTTVSVLINNAGIHGPIGPFYENDMKLWDKAFRINFLAPVHFSNYFVKHFIKNKSGSIINISGGGGTNCRENFSSYAAAKTSLIRFTEILAKELVNLNIQVNAIAPGQMNTKLLKELVNQDPKYINKKELQKIKNLINKKDNNMSKVLDLIIFLLSPRGKSISGKIISSLWDNWTIWPDYVDFINKSDVYTLRRITGRERKFNQGDL